MIKLIVVPILLAFLLYVFHSFYKFSSPEEKMSFVSGAFKAVVFLSIAILVLTTIVILF